MRRLKILVVVALWSLSATLTPFETPPGSKEGCGHTTRQCLSHGRVEVLYLAVGGSER